MENDKQKLEDIKEAMAEETREKFFKEAEKKRKKEKIRSHEQSLEDSQGEPKFSGSSSNAPGNVDHSKRHSNMDQRNF